MEQMKETLLRRMANHEDNFVERKPRNAGQHDFKKTIVAFANTVRGDQTGVLFIGVENDGTVSGVDNPDAMQKKIRIISRNQCYPPIPVQSIVIDHSDGPVVAVVISETKNTPHFAGAAYLREGSETVEASAELFEDLIASRTDVGRAILKYKDEEISVRALRKELGKPEELGDARYNARHTCYIKGCNAHYVTLYDCGTGNTITEPLRNVTVSWDHKRCRFELVVEPR
jgi:hypothetical protein